MMTSRLLSTRVKPALILQRPRLISQVYQSLSHRQATSRRQVLKARSRIIAHRQLKDPVPPPLRKPQSRDSSKREALSVSTSNIDNAEDGHNRSGPSKKPKSDEDFIRRPGMPSNLEVQRVLTTYIPQLDACSNIRGSKQSIETPIFCRVIRRS